MAISNGKATEQNGMSSALCAGKTNQIEFEAGTGRPVLGGAWAACALAVGAKRELIRSLEDPNTL